MEDVKKYWREVDGDHGHGFKTYAATGDQVVSELFDGFCRICPTSGHVLEIGCNTGTNLDYLRRKGFRQFTGIDINAAAMENFHTLYPETFGLTKTMVGDALPLMRSIESNSMDAVFSRGCLINIPYEDEDIFDEIGRVARNIIIIMEADHRKAGSVLFPRDYEKIFAKLGFTLILKKLLVGGNWGNVDPARVRDPWLRIFIRDSVTPTPLPIM
jgi:SAM-dependent methyltransferase